MSRSSSDDEDEEFEDSHSKGQVSVSEAHYVAKGNDKRVLICLCIGLKDEKGSAYIDVDGDPWDKQAADVRKPKLAEHLKPEIIRRSGTLGIKIPRPGQWNVEKCHEWLNANPITDLDCKEFLSHEALRVSTILKNALKEKDTEASAIRLGVWAGPKPYLRLVHCIIDDLVRSQYLRRDAVMSRTQLDSRNSDTRPPTAYELIANKWNDPSFNPETAVSSCHYDFASPIDIGHDSVKHLRPAVAGDVKDRLTDIRARLIRMIKKWERSGQGDGGRDNEEDEDLEDGGGSSAAPTADPENLTSLALGKLEGRSQFAMDSRQNFLSDGKYGKLNPWYLYFWELADKYDLLASTVTELSSAVGAVDANAVPAAITTTRDSSTTSKAGSNKRNQRTPKRKGRGGNDDVSSSSALSEDQQQQAELTSAFVTLGRETKKSRLEHRVTTLRHEARSINNRIAELKGIMYKHELDALETKSRDKIALFQRIVADYTKEMADLRNQLSDTMILVNDAERLLHE
jgi:hypothetical protein